MAAKEYETGAAPVGNADDVGLVVAECGEDIGEIIGGAGGRVS
jgi:hypothetical protein